MKILFVGLPSSGKTTYLGALTHLLTSGRHKTALRLGGLSASETHTSALEERWLTCAQVLRTRQRSANEGSFQVHIDELAVQAELVLPDLSGEAFRQPAARGRCRPGLFTGLVESEGLVVFTNADRPQDDRLLFDAAPQYAALEDAFAAQLAEEGLVSDGEQSTEPGDAASQESPPGPFNPDDMPEEVLLTELLQQINRKPFIPRRRCLAVVISAWDVVGTGEAPIDWWNRKRPMVSQFLRHNSDLWEIEVWGVSAQGGNLPADAERLLRFKEPVDRIQVVGTGASLHDLSAPISWVLRRSTGTAP